MIVQIALWNGIAAASLFLAVLVGGIISLKKADKDKKEPMSWFVRFLHAALVGLIVAFLSIVVTSNAIFHPGQAATINDLKTDEPYRLVKIVGEDNNFGNFVMQDGRRIFFLAVPGYQESAFLQCRNDTIYVILDKSGEKVAVTASDYKVIRQYTDQYQARDPN